MDTENQNFEELQKLLALKRREQPPQTFFRGFPGQVAHHLHDPSPTRPLCWNERFGLDSPFRPVWFCGLGALVCGLLAAGTFYALRVPSETKEKAGAQVGAGPFQSPGPAGESLPEAVKPGETRSVVEPVPSPGTSPLEQRKLDPSPTPR
jgi:hypothetical protein